MGRAWIVLGDKTSHGGTVISASGFTSTGGVSVARKGDMVTCPRDGHGTCPIISGDYAVIIDGQPVARKGDSTACGAILIAGQRFTTVGVEHRNAKGSVPQEASFEDFFSPYEPQSDETPNIETNSFNERFQLLGQSDNQPLVDHDYVIVRATGQEEHGVTDDDGYTHLLSNTSENELIEIFIRIYKNE
jgi:uncharacterized Zn-binding protein involved in type VI secretion